MLSVGVTLRLLCERHRTLTGFNDIPGLPDREAVIDLQASAAAHPYMTIR
jgi:hypothetical protein